MSTERKPVYPHAACVRYWVQAAREQNRWRIQLRRDARAEHRVKKSGPLYDASRACRDRRSVFMGEARRMRDRVRAALAACRGEA